MAILRHGGVAGVAGDGSLFGLMAGDAVTHAGGLFEGDGGAFGDGAVALFAGVSGGGVGLVAKGDEGWDAIDADPGDGLFVLGGGGEALDIRLIGGDGYVAEHAFGWLGDGYDGAVAAGLVAVGTGHLCGLDVEFVVEGDGLGWRVGWGCGRGSGRHRASGLRLKGSRAEQQRKHNDPFLHAKPPLPFRLDAVVVCGEV